MEKLSDHTKQPQHQLVAICWYMSFHQAVYTNNIPTNRLGYQHFLSDTTGQQKTRFLLTGAGFLDFIGLC
jgi:hypothetical protein